jgi:hypothetical protein
MRTSLALLFLALLGWPGAASGQSFEFHASAGPTITDTGNSLAAGVGFLPMPRLAIAFNVERTHLPSRTTRDGRTVSSFRGGTLLLGTAELRFAPFDLDRVEPYGLAGIADGVSRPNVNDTFPDLVTNHVRAMFAGGGVNVRLNERMTLFVEARMMVGAEGNDGLVAVAPARAGIAWRF